MIKRNFPNALTCCNLLCGCLAIKETLLGDLTIAFAFIGLAAIFDFFDGFVARLLKVTSPIGKDLDSLADAVTFGVTPAFIIFMLFKNSIALAGLSSSHYLNYLAYISFSIALFSVIRLAKFNNDTRQSQSFIGLPTPANAIFIASLPLIMHVQNNIYFEFGFIVCDQPLQNMGAFTVFILNPWVLTALSIVQSILLVAELPLLALKFKHFAWSGNERRYILLATCVVLFCTLGFTSIPLSILAYILISLTEKQNV